MKDNEGTVPLTPEEKNAYNKGYQQAIRDMRVALDELD